jgi:non-specific serine/threonine protein kinase
LSWSLEGGDVEGGLAIASGLQHYWTTRGHIDEGRSALTALLEASAGEPPTTLRARGTAVAATLASWHVDFAAAAELGSEALRLAEALDDHQLMLSAYVANGWATVGPMPAVSRDYFSRAIELARAQGDGALERLSLGGLSVALVNLGDLDEAMAVSVDVAERSERAGDLYNAGYAHVGIGQIKLRRGDASGALGDLLITLRRFRDADADIGIAVALDFIALVALQTGDANRAVRLGAFADRLRREAGGGGSTLISNDEPPLVQARRVMDAATFDRAFAEGEALDLDGAELEARAIEPA